MISLKQFHYFFIFVSILISGYYGMFEMTTPSSPGFISNLFAGISFIITVGLIFYGFTVIKMFKKYK
jgi:hypothetical protein